ncbi:unnamed protein product [Closterium sp. NIES-64]|nr:unnamed protein product [Closterium sp. NIES-64]
MLLRALTLPPSAPRLHRPSATLISRPMDVRLPHANACPVPCAAIAEARGAEPAERRDGGLVGGGAGRRGWRGMGMARQARGGSRASGGAWSNNSSRAAPINASSATPHSTSTSTTISSSSATSTNSTSTSSSSSSSEGGSRGGEVVLLFDVMDTLVRDPFYHHIPAFFQMTMPELLQQKHPTAWVDFECGRISEHQLHQRFFADGRHFDLQGLKATMQGAYEWVEGMEPLLAALNAHGFATHAFTNYPPWYQMIEDKLRLSRYLHWTFVSCHMGVRKPSPEAYEAALATLTVDPSTCIFIDDRESNVLAARGMGMTGITFQSAKQLAAELSPILNIEL